MRVLHIATHVGGGIGSSYVGLGTCGHSHKIILLEAPIDLNSLSKVKAAGFEIMITADVEEIAQEMKLADVVVFNWTHHPALTKFFTNMPPVPIRSILWCHVSGNYFPEIRADFIRRFNQVMFATPFSLTLPQLQPLGKKFLEEHCTVVYGQNDMSKFAQIELKPHENFNIGYVGTLGFCKLNPKFVEYCAAVDVPNAKFIMVGEASTQEEILTEAATRNIADKFVFTGRVSDVPKELAQMDIFSYLLNPQHFGATENALLEAMAAGLPVIALNQCVEKVIVTHGETGLLVKNPEEYAAAVRRLHDDKDFAAQLGRNAKESILRRFGIKSNRERFFKVCNAAYHSDKKLHNFREFFGATPADYFLSCVEADKDCFLENRAQDAGLIFRYKTKGSPNHYLSYFPDDDNLRGWVNQLNK